MVPKLLTIYFVDDCTSKIWSQQAAMQAYSRHGVAREACEDTQSQREPMRRTRAFADEVLLRLCPGNLDLDIFKIGYHDMRFLPPVVSFDAGHQALLWHASVSGRWNHHQTLIKFHLIMYIAIMGRHRK